jgi:hypothetical protein
VLSAKRANAAPAPRLQRAPGNGRPEQGGRDPGDSTPGVRAEHGEATAVGQQPGAPPRPGWPVPRPGGAGRRGIAGSSSKPRACLACTSRSAAPLTVCTARANS